jgi:hypothetical protein
VTESSPRARRRRWGFLAAGAVTIVAIAFGTIYWASTLQGPVDMRGNRVVADDIPTSAPSASATPDIGSKFVVESVGLDVPLGAINIADGEVNPPGFTSAYWIRDQGVSIDHAADGTVFVVMHSLRGGGIGPGNYLIDVENRTAQVELGANIDVDGVTYEVTGSYALDKAELAYSSTVWANTPGRLVVITCLQRPDGGPSIDNLVIEARKA